MQTKDRSQARGITRLIGTLFAAMLATVLVVAFAGVGTAASEPGAQASAKRPACKPGPKSPRLRRDCRDKRIGNPQNPRRQRYDGKRIKLAGLGRCDFLDTTTCLQPWPNDYFTVRDTSTATDRRVNLNAASMPANKNNQKVDPTDYNRADGFSPGQLIVNRVPGLDRPAALNRTNAVDLTDLRAYDDANQPIVVIDTVTDERHPIWVELDSRATKVSDVNLMVHGSVNFEEGRRYIVAMRNLKRANGKVIPASRNFRLYRDRLLTGKKPIEKRRSHFEQLFRELKQAGINRGKLYVAWDFTVASENSIAGRVLAMRDDAFAELGDTNLADGVDQGTPPSWTPTSVEDFNPCSDGLPACEAGENDQVIRRIQGTIDVPCYLDTDNCPPGSKFKFASASSKLPTFNNSFRVDVPFVCIIPRSVDAGATLDPARTSLAGHGLLGNRFFVDQTAPLANENNIATCGVNWAGFSSDDIATGIVPSLNNLSNFPKIGDHVQQAFVNFLYLGRLMDHATGFSNDPEFQIDVDGGGPDGSAILPDELHYFGVSHGGIMGGSLTALAPDHTRAVLNVPAMNHSTLLLRSIHWDNYGFVFNQSYTNERERPLILSMIQMLWDRAENNGFAHHITTDPLPDTPQHQVLMQVSYGDHQVTNYAAEVMARTIGASVLTPALDPGRHWDVNPFFGIPAISTFPYTGSALVYWDGGPVGFAGLTGPGTGAPPLTSDPPRMADGFGGDPHGYIAGDPEGRLQGSDFMDGSLPSLALACGGDPPPCHSNGFP